MGASPTRSGESGSARDYAVKSKRTEIVQFFDEIIETQSISSSDESTVIINGSIVTKESMQSYKTLLACPAEEDTLGSSPANFRARTKSLDTSKDRQRKLIAQLLDINAVLFESKPEGGAKWQGILRFPDSATNKWVSEYCSVDENLITVFSDASKNISLQGVISIQAYSESDSRFSLLYARTSNELIR